jgi:hypothetical protein
VIPEAMGSAPAPYRHREAFLARLSTSTLQRTAKIEAQHPSSTSRGPEWLGSEFSKGGAWNRINQAGPLQSNVAPASWTSVLTNVTAGGSVTNLFAMQEPITILVDASMIMNHSTWYTWDALLGEFWLPHGAHPLGEPSARPDPAAITTHEAAGLAVDLLERFIAAPTSAEPSTATTAAAIVRDFERDMASRRLRLILDNASREASEPGEETPLEHQLAAYISEYGGGALASIYRALFERETSPDLAAAVIVALALLPRRMERVGRGSLFRACLTHTAPKVRFEAARALLRLGDPLAPDALRQALERELHTEIRRNLTQVLDAFFATRGTAAR